jgi:ApaG protein
VIIENQGRETVHLLSRHWMITNARGELTEVKGPGVVGEQPVLKPGERFEYTSGAPLNTPSGMMGGAYQMERAVSVLILRYRRSRWIVRIRAHF